MLKPGDPAPAFTLPADDGTVVSLASLRGRTVVLYFYPKDDTSGCTTEACEIRDAWTDVEATGAVVLGVSPDGVASHVKFKRKYSLPFRLLADTDHRVAEAYGAWGEKSMYGAAGGFRPAGPHTLRFLKSAPTSAPPTPLCSAVS